MIIQNMGKERENLPKIEEIPEERHTQTHVNLFEIILQSYMKQVARGERGGGEEGVEGRLMKII